MKENFYCYSNRLSVFLELFGIEYIDKGVNLNTGKSYKIYKKSNRLQLLLEEWDHLKSLNDLEEVIKKQ